LNRHLVNISSDVRAKVKETPQYLRATSFASMDTAGPFEKRANEAYFNVTPTEHDWPEKQKQEWLTPSIITPLTLRRSTKLTPAIMCSSCHLTLRQRAGSRKFSAATLSLKAGRITARNDARRRFGSPTSSSPSEEDIKRAAKYRMAQADEALLRLCRLCVSIKMHTQNMSLDEATKFFQDNCYYEEKPARQEAIRGTFDPGYLNYTLGKLQILKLRDDYKAQQGDDFSLQKFHNELLNHGMPPIRLLREIMLKDQSKWDQVL